MEPAKGFRHFCQYNKLPLYDLSVDSFLQQARGPLQVEATIQRSLSAHPIVPSRFSRSNETMTTIGQTKAVKSFKCRRFFRMMAATGGALALVLRRKNMGAPVLSPCQRWKIEDHAFECVRRSVRS